SSPLLPARRRPSTPRPSMSRSTAITTDKLLLALSSISAQRNLPASLRRARHEEDHFCPFGPVGPVRLRSLGHGRQGSAVNLGAARPRWSRWSSDLSRTLGVANLARQRGPLLAGLLALHRGPCHGLGGPRSQPKPDNK